MNKPVPHIRPAHDTDGPGIAALLQSVFAEYDGCLYAADEFPELAAPARAYQARGGSLWVAELDGRIIAVTAIVPKYQSGVWELSKVYCHAAWRGQGIAAKMLTMAMAFAAARAGNRIILYSDTRFTRGHAFYARHGFVQMPGTRVLHDVSSSLEFGFTRDLAPGAA